MTRRDVIKAAMATIAATAPIRAAATTNVSPSRHGSIYIKSADGPQRDVALHAGDRIVVFGRKLGMHGQHVDGGGPSHIEGVMVGPMKSVLTLTIHDDGAMGESRPSPCPPRVVFNNEGEALWLDERGGYAPMR